MSEAVEDIIQRKLDKTCEINGWNSLYVQEYTAAAAVKASVLFQALGFDYGDRIPGVYKLEDTIKELIATLMSDGDKDREMKWTSSGMFRVSRFWDDYAQQWELNISFELQDIYEHRVLDDSDE